MQGQLFRKKTLERISSPEQLQDYMRVTNPGTWMVLGAVIALLVGLIVASALCNIESTIEAKGTIDETGSSVVMELPLEKKGTVKEGMPVEVADQTARVSYVYESDNALHVTAALDAGKTLPEGTYDVEIVTETMNPISFLMD